MSTVELAGVPVGVSGGRVRSPADHRNEIIAALDFLITGFLKGFIKRGPLLTLDASLDDLWIRPSQYVFQQKRRQICFLLVEKLNVEFGLNLRILDLEAEVRQPDTNTFEKADEILGLPMLYLGFKFRPLEKISLEAEGRGIAYSSNHYYDLIGRIKLNLLGPAFLAGGWRHEDLKIDEDDIEAELTFSGPFLEAGLSF